MDINLHTALDLDALPTSKRIITIKESRSGDASFLVGHLLSDIVKKKEHIIAILFHNLIGHYHGISVKLGYNLRAHKDVGLLHIFDGSSYISNVDGVKELDVENSLKEIFLKAYSTLENAKSSTCTIFLEHPTDLIIAGFDLRSVVCFMHYIRSLVAENVNLIILMKDLPLVNEHRVFNTSVKYFSQVFIEVSGLETGRAIDLSGSMIVHHRKMIDDSPARRQHYHYQLLDKRIRVFAPGFVQIR